MLQRVKEILVFVLGFGLPLHGALTVFGPPELRWWKELILLGLVVLTFIGVLNDRKQFFKYQFHLKKIITWWAFYAVLFLIWGLFLVFINPDFKTSLMAYRYLGLGFVATLLGYALWQTKLYSAKNGYTMGVKVFHNFCTGLLLGTFASAIFGFWAKFLGGYQILDQWYSTTISSWVPGQTIPLYHQVGDFIRLQGASSGPVEYAHLALMGLWYGLLFRIQGQPKYNLVRVFVSATLLLGIWQSGSRAALLGAIILFVFKGGMCIKPYLKLPPFRWSIDKLAALLLVLIVLTGMAKFTFSKAILGNVEIMNKNIVRISDIDHVTRPIEALNKALEKPFLGNLGELGPAARAKNLAINNNDQALIAESVPFDIMAQLGFVGLFIWLAFFGFYYRQASIELRILLIAFAPLMLLATIFDMTPVSISFFFILGLGLALPRIVSAFSSDHKVVFNLKKMAFKIYTEKVWGWNEANQLNYVERELAGGGIYLVLLEGEVIATYCLVKEIGHTKLFSFYIHPNLQSLGLGTYLLNEIMTARTLRLQVLKVNFSAKAFYESNGFENSGEDEHHWHLQRLT